MNRSDATLLTIRASIGAGAFLVSKSTDSDGVLANDSWLQTTRHIGRLI
jgi:hypothetical protein